MGKRADVLWPQPNADIRTHEPESSLETISHRSRPFFDVARPISSLAMTACRPIRLNAFDMACIGHIQHGMWTHPRDHSSDYTSLDHWVRLARMLEHGLFDGLFLADVLGAYNVYGGNADASLRGGVQIPLLDPMALVPAMAHATTHLGFGVTCNLAYEAPFLFARRMATLDHLTRGRIGWNIVTGIWTAPRAPWVSLARSSMTTAMIWRTNIYKCSTRCGKAVGRTML